MKFFSVIFSLLLLFSCGDANNGSNNGGNNGGNNRANNGGNGNNGNSALDDFDCSTVFDEGDYSTACFSEGKLPEFTQTSTTPTVCFYKIGKRENNDLSLITVNVSVHEPDIVEQLFASFRTIGTGTMVEVGDIGNEAFLDKEDSTKTLTVRKSNILLSFVVEGRAPAPCLFEDDELKTFAKLVVANIK